MLDLDPVAFDEGPFAQEIIQIELGLKSWPATAAKRHHFIPRFLLNRFAMPDERLFQLDKRTGRPQRVAARRAASRHHFYTFENDEGERSSDIEAIFAMVESHAAPALQRLETDRQVSEVDRATIAHFLAFLWARTPAARKRAEALTKEAAAGLLASKINDRKAFMDLLRAQAATDDELRMSPEAAEELRERTIGMLGDGSLCLVDPDGGATTGALIEMAHDTAVLMFSAMDWTLVCAHGAEFVTSDRGTASFDPTPRHPWSGSAIYSSPNAETYFPISSDCCLLLSPGNPELRLSDAQLAKVMEINLRIYGWAEAYIYGRNQEAVVAVRRALKSKPHVAAPPSPPRQVVVIERDPDDDRLARAHVARGWQPYLVELDEDGKPRQLDYMVIGEEGNAVEIAVNSNDLVRRRALKAAGYPPDSDVQLPGRVETKPGRPGAILPSR